MTVLISKVSIFTKKSFFDSISKFLKKNNPFCPTFSFVLVISRYSTMSIGKNYRSVNHVNLSNLVILSNVFIITDS
jgi:hypothetical protein